MLTSYVMDHDMNVQIQVQILLGYLQPVHLGYQNYQILDLDHHQPSPQTFVKIITTIYALILFFNISSVVRYMLNFCWPKVRRTRLPALPHLLPKNYPSARNEIQMSKAVKYCYAKVPDWL